jgi:ABC-type transport system involved in multi-copper enzyme maturation permease subunit
MPIEILAGPLIFLLAVFLILIGVILIILIGALIFFFPAIIAALIVWFITGGDKILTALTFLIIAAISLIKRK